MKANELLAAFLRFGIGTGGAPEMGFKCRWDRFLAAASKEGVAGLVCDTLYDLCNLPGNEALLAEVNDAVGGIRHKWMSVEMSHMRTNEKVDLHSRELTGIFAAAGYRSCILKGQSNALLYPIPARRSPGDIDIWVDAGRREILDFVRSKWISGRVVYHHVEVKVYPDIDVEVHYIPAWLWNPFHNARLQRYFRASAPAQFEVDPACGFAHPTPVFNLVFSAVHMLKHYFDGNNTLKQLVDYCFILKSSSAEERAEAYSTLVSLGLGRYAGRLMWDLSATLNVPDSILMCPVPDKCPPLPLSESLWRNPWRLWHRFWRILHGYV